MNSVDRAIHHVFGLTVTGVLGVRWWGWWGWGELQEKLGLLGGKDGGWWFCPLFYPLLLFPFLLTGIACIKFCFPPLASLWIFPSSPWLQTNTPGWHIQLIRELLCLLWRISSLLASQVASPVSPGPPVPVMWDLTRSRREVHCIRL